MADVKDIAEYIIEKLPSDVTALKLQKLVFYSQAWSLAWDKKPLFDGEFEAWVKGPVSRDLYREHRKELYVSTVNGDAHVLTPPEEATVDAVLEFYGVMSANELVELSHREEAWRSARGGLPSEARSTNEMDIDGYFDLAATMSSGKKEVPAELRRGYSMLLAMAEDEVDDLEEHRELNLEEMSAWLTGSSNESQASDV